MPYNHARTTTRSLVVLGSTKEISPSSGPKVLRTRASIPPPEMQGKWQSHNARRGAVPLNDSVRHQRAASKHAICDRPSDSTSSYWSSLAARWLLYAAVVHGCRRHCVAPHSTERAHQVASRADTGWLRGYEQSAPPDVVGWAPTCSFLGFIQQRLVKS